jgi:hypothetical protein
LRDISPKDIIGMVSVSRGRPANLAVTLPIALIG